MQYEYISQMILFENKVEIWCQLCQLISDFGRVKCYIFPFFIGLYCLVNNMMQKNHGGNFINLQFLLQILMMTTIGLQKDQEQILGLQLQQEAMMMMMRC